MVLFETEKTCKTVIETCSPFCSKTKRQPSDHRTLTQRATDLVANITPPDPPPRVHTDVTDNPVITSRRSRTDNPILTPLPSTAVPSSLSGVHKRMLEFITEVAQELYAKGQLRVQPYAGYLRSKRAQSSTHDSPL